eukprot:1176225-Prorocentrum_minimum.AAC.1
MLAGLKRGEAVGESGELDKAVRKGEGSLGTRGGEGGTHHAHVEVPGAGLTLTLQRGSELAAHVQLGFELRRDVEVYSVVQAH